MNNIGKQHSHLLFLCRSADLCDRCTALVTELGVRWQFGAARPTRQSRRCQRTATTVIHVSIVSPLVNDVRHIAVPSPTRSLETLECRPIPRRRLFLLGPGRFGRMRRLPWPQRTERNAASPGLLYARLRQAEAISESSRVAPRTRVAY